jgi:hypothetical protein
MPGGREQTINMTAGAVSADPVTLLAMLDARQILESARIALRALLERPGDLVSRRLAEMTLDQIDSSLDETPTAAPHPRLGPGEPTPRPSQPPHETRGHAGFGYRWAEDRSTQIPVASELRTLTKMWELRREGKTLSAIADFLNTHPGFPSRTGKPWNLQTVRLQLARIEDYPNLRSDMDRHGRV